MNYQKIQEAIEKAKLKYNKTAEQLKEEKWYETVKNPRTENFFQWSDLKAEGIDPPEQELAKKK